MLKISLTQKQIDLLIIVIFALLCVLVVSNIPETKHAYNEYFGL